MTIPTKNALDAWTKLHARIIRNFDAQMATTETSLERLIDICDAMRKVEESMYDCDPNINFGKVLPREFFNELSATGRAAIMAAGWTLND